jgi:hypothetical protein
MKSEKRRNSHHDQQENEIRHSLTTIVLAAALMAGLSLCVTAGDKKISKKDLPAPVLSAFEKAYSKAEIKGLGMETENGKTYYEIESLDGKTKRDILYLADGTVAEIEEAVPYADLPASVKAAVAKEYPKGKIAKCEKTTRGSEVTFEMVVQEGKASHEVVIDPAGKILKNTKSGAEKE